MIRFVSIKYRILIFILLDIYFVSFMLMFKVRVRDFSLNNFKVILIVSSVYFCMFLCFVLISIKS